MHFGHVLRDQSKGNRLRSIVLLVVAKGDRLKLIDRFAGCVHGLNVMFVSARRDVVASESAVAVYRDQIWIGANLRLNIGINVADIAAVAHVLTSNADGNNIVGRGDTSTGPSAQGSVEGSAGVGRECKDSDCRIAVTSSVGKKRPVTVRCIVLAIGITTESLNPGCCIDITGCVANERIHARDGVTEACSIVVERERAGNRVVVTSGVTRERFSSGGSVVSTGGIATQRKLTVGSVSDASRVVTEGRRPVGGVEAASGVAKKRKRSVGRVLEASRVAGESPGTVGCVEVASGVAI